MKRTILLFLLIFLLLSATACRNDAEAFSFFRKNAPKPQKTETQEESSEEPMTEETSRSEEGAKKEDSDSAANEESKAEIKLLDRFENDINSDPYSFEREIKNVTVLLKMEMMKFHIIIMANIYLLVNQ